MKDGFSQVTKINKIIFIVPLSKKQFVLVRTLPFTSLVFSTGDYPDVVKIIQTKKDLNSDIYTPLKNLGFLKEFEIPSYGDYCSALFIVTTSCNL